MLRAAPDTHALQVTILETLASSPRLGTVHVLGPGQRSPTEAHKLQRNMDDGDWQAGQLGQPGEAEISRLDPTGRPVHRGWPPLGGRRRWLEPFVLVLLAEGGGHGYALIGQLSEMGVEDGNVDVGQVYKTLRDLEQAGHVVSKWSNEPTGPQRRDYELTASGRQALAEWAAVMRERGRLIEDFEARYRRARGDE